MCGHGWDVALHPPHEGRGCRDFERGRMVCAECVELTISNTAQAAEKECYVMATRQGTTPHVVLSRSMRLLLPPGVYQGVCNLGLRECSTYQAADAASGKASLTAKAGDCPECTGGTTGPCKSNTGSCKALVAGACLYGAGVCWRDALAPTPCPGPQPPPRQLDAGCHAALAPRTQAHNHQHAYIPTATSILSVL